MGATYSVSTGMIPGICSKQQDFYHSSGCGRSLFLCLPFRGARTGGADGFRRQDKAGGGPVFRKLLSKDRAFDQAVPRNDGGMR